MGGWDQALDAMTDLRRQFGTQDGLQYLVAFGESIGGGRSYDPDTGEYGPLDHSEHGHEHGQALMHAAVGSVLRSDPVWVSEEVVQLVEAAADHPDFRLEPVYLDDVFIPAAFCLLERPLSLIDMQGMRMMFRAISWVQVHDQFGQERGITFCLWSHADDKDDYILRYIEEWGAEQARIIIGGSPLVLSHAGIVNWGDTKAMTEPVTASMMRQLEVLWRLAKQEVVLHGQERASRPTWKRAAWKGIKEVTVMTLRRARPKHYEGDGREVDWSHRWLVRGHWRNQPYKIEGKWETRQIWIAPYEKGPENKPFVAKQRAVEFVR